MKYHKFSLVMIKKSSQIKAWNGKKFQVILKIKFVIKFVMIYEALKVT